MIIWYLILKIKHRNNSDQNLEKGNHLRLDIQNNVEIDVIKLDQLVVSSHRFIIIKAAAAGIYYSFFFCVLAHLLLLFAGM